MKKILIGLVLSCVIGFPAYAVLVSLFQDTDTSLERSKDIVIAECLSTGDSSMRGLRSVEVNIVKVLKGEEEPGRCRVATIYSMEPRVTYLLYGTGGNALGTDFLATAQLSVVPLPSAFNINELNGKDLKEQVQCIFSRRLFEVERQLAPLLKEKKLLEQAVSDRQIEWYESDGPLNIEDIRETQTNPEGRHPIALDLMGKKLEWSHSTPGKRGFFYFTELGSNKPLWEFAPCNASKIEDLDGRSLKARFYGRYTPGRGDSSLGHSGEGAIHVIVGQVLLARTVNDRGTIFIIQIAAQQVDREVVSIGYAVVSK